jgi:hypothetical protein
MFPSSRCCLTSFGLVHSNPVHNRDLSDETGGGLIEGPIPSTWLMMSKLRTM